MNRQAEATFGWSRDEAVGRVLSDTIIPPRYRESHLRGLEHYLDSGDGPLLDQRLEIEGLHRDGHELPIELDELRLTDLLARYSGEEFGLVFPAWPIGNALAIVDRIRAATPDGLTCSAGLTA